MKVSANNGFIALSCTRLQNGFLAVGSGHRPGGGLSLGSEQAPGFPQTSGDLHEIAPSA
ncbi:hypothetical protein THICB1_100466 [Thiomonas arsenitoxydans]|uniref:Uncharacterized protein n=1 Tax=Thiomonas arsenitoxydans (strain DSM 22701 / CIP 110005 / 3As) TaxID=426114 RepID=A0ABM9T2D5_THIA3|nr:hypothetical protein THICB2_50086 [Thiomonas sp. CB2]CQR27107.1 hypothetical protein THICB1_100466 [Thiomonas arsenitoxydans]CQR44083.1 hypothetical protein THICB3470152 [Thiomonas sp. CB3]VDY06074.1 protein of unknown function [Thiomonas sp. Bio17B3]VDY10628.1 protein of unknown function [Thiomonas sp. Sup16B3]VDY14337.1 conserved protein of unknown function [Thiomonas sp. OC7]